MRPARSERSVDHIGGRTLFDEVVFHVVIQHASVLVEDVDVGDVFALVEELVEEICLVVDILRLFEVVPLTVLAPEAERYIKLGIS